MKILKTATLCLIILFYFSTLSQAQKFNWGNPAENDKSLLSEVIGKNKDYLFALKKKRIRRAFVVGSSPASYKLFFNKYSIAGNSLKLSQEIFIKPPKGRGDMDKTYQVIDIFMVENKIYLFATDYDKSKKTRFAFAQQLDENGKPVGEAKVIDEVNFDAKKSKGNSGSYWAYLSNDSTKVLLVWNPPFEKYANEAFGYKVFDKDMKLLSDLDVKLPYKDKTFSVTDYQLAANGNIYQLAKIDEHPVKVGMFTSTKKIDNQDYYYEIITINPKDSNSLNEFQLKLENKRITDVAFHLDDKGDNILCAGFYSNKGDKSLDVNGIFYMRLNRQSGKVDASSYKELDKEFILDVTNQKKLKEGQGISNDFVIKDFLPKKDGGVYVVAELSYEYLSQVTSTSSNAGGGSTQSTYYVPHYVRGNILCFNVASDGQIVWYANIPKTQNTASDEGMYSSYIVQKDDNDKLFFIYNDAKGNELITDPKKLKTMYSPKKSSSMLAVIDDNGKYKRHLLQTAKESDYIIMPQIHCLLPNRSTLLYSEDPGSGCCFITFKKPYDRIGTIDLQ